ncbi:MAG: 1,4-dihydroxy-2-naphthoate polyprenyltransferase [Chloroflexi bacterium]|nr:1,4-dihydroxy-2-naphthoate polyprenyltransferase [Chloroflexota bacterium]
MQSWLLAIRPRTLPAAIAPVIVGSALAYHDSAFQPLAALAALLAAVLLQIGANLANDVYDFRRGADANRVGPTRVTTAGLLSPRQVEVGMWVVFALAASFGLYLIALGGWPILFVGLVSVIAAIAYTGGPFPLGYNGLGDLFTFLFFGLIAVMGTYYVQAGEVTGPVFIASLPMGALVTNILVVNNVRDADTDRAAGKRTLAVIFGRGAARMEYDVLLGLAYLAPVVLMAGFGFGGWILLPLLSLPLAVRLTRALRALGGPALNHTLAGTAQLAVIYAALFAAGAALN